MTTPAVNDIRYSGPGLPRGYRSYPLQYQQIKLVNSSPTAVVYAPAGKRAVLDLQFVSTTVADYDGLALKFKSTQSAVIADTTFTFDDDAAPPSIANVVKLSGLTTVVQIAAQLALSMSLVDQEFKFRCLNLGGGLLRIFQTQPGSDGNTIVDFTGDWDGLIEINGIDAFSVDNVYFYGGVSLDVPALWGPKRGLIPSNTAIVKSTPVSEL